MGAYEGDYETPLWDQEGAYFDGMFIFGVAALVGVFVYLQLLLDRSFELDLFGIVVGAILIGVLALAGWCFYRCWRSHKFDGYVEKKKEYKIASGKVPIHGPNGYVHGNFALGFGSVSGSVTTEACVSVIYVDDGGGMRSYTKPINDADLRNVKGVDPTFEIRRYYWKAKNGMVDPRVHHTEHTIVLDFKRLFSGHGMYQVGG